MVFSVLSFRVCLCYFLIGVLSVSAQKRKVLILSFDGFRWDYVDHFSTTNLDKFKAEGVFAPEGITPAFITKTYPCHYTIATGLYAESHGIVNNFMYDPVFNASFDYDNMETRWWNGARPLWTAATLQGLKVGTYFWPGAGVELEGVRPQEWKTYNALLPLENGIHQTIRWLAIDDYDFVMTYFSEPDSTGHTFGAFSTNVKMKVHFVDDLIGSLIANLKELKVFNNTDIIVVSDHGMTNVTADDEHVIVLSDYLDLNANILAIPDEGTLVNILPKPGKEDSVYEKLVNAHPHVKVRRKAEIPERFHYRHNRRILPIVLFPDEGYFITKERPYKFDVGQHGYDNTLPSMRPIFFARGPSFKAGYRVPNTYQSVNIYPLVCHLLGIQPSPNNGSLEASEAILQDNIKPVKIFRSQETSVLVNKGETDLHRSRLIVLICSLLMVLMGDFF